MLVLIELGDEVIILVFYWLSYLEMVKFVGGELIILIIDFEIGYKVILE